MKLSAILAPMIAAGVPASVILDTVKAWEEQQENALEKRRETDRIRQARAREKTNSHVTSRDVTVTVPSHASALRTGSNSFSSEPKGSSEIERKEEREETRANALAPSFEAFWTIFPNKVGKRDAEKAFAKAIKRATVETIMAGLRGYVGKTDDRPWCNPSTFLNQDRWNDAPAIVTPRQSRPPPRVDGFAQAIREDLERESRRGTQFGDFKHSIESEPERDFSSAVFARVIAAS